jgi:hypothetical protein
LTWFVIEADITAQETPEETRLAFFTVLVVRQLDREPTPEEAAELVGDYLRDVHAPFTWDLRLVSIEEAGPPPEWSSLAPDF